MAADQPILEVRDLCHGFDRSRESIRHLSFSLARGEFLVLAGPNGSGKTTLLRLLTGLLRPVSGEILLKGSSIHDDLVTARKAVGLVFQDADTQILGETVYSEVAFGPENLGLPAPDIQAAVNRALGDLQLEGLEDRHPATLSGGEKRRLTIAGILAMDPEVILFDEPFANLDYPGICRLARRIRDLHRAGTSIILATHDLEPVLAWADRIMVMDKGEIRDQGRVRDLAPRLGDLGLRPWCPACHPLGGDL